VLLAFVLGLVLPGSAVAFGPLSSFGSYGTGPGEFAPEGGIAIGPNSHTYVADFLNGRVVEFAPDGSFVRSFGSMGEPEGIAVAENGRVYVSSRSANRIFVFWPNGDLLDEFGNPGEGAGNMVEPSGVAVDPISGNIFVADQRMHRVDVFTPGGQFVRAFGKEVKFGGGGNVCTLACQEGVAGSGAGALRTVRGIAFAPGTNSVYLADSLNQRIDVFTPEGDFLFAFGKGVRVGGGNVCTSESGCMAGGETPEAGALGDPTWLAFDRAGNLNVSTMVNHRIDVFSPGGTFLRAFGQGVLDGQAVFQTCTVVCQAGLIDPDPGSGSLLTPEGMAIDCGGSLAVLEVEDNLPFEESFARIERFGEVGSPAPPCTEPLPGEPIQVSLIRVPSDKFRFAGLVKNRGNGSAVLFVRVPGPGRVILKGRGVRRLSRGAQRAMRVRLPVKPKVRLKRFLKRHGKARIRVEVTFRPVGGEERSMEKPTVLKRKRR
jgi:6-bladed beta-propeller protein